jgi:hypothetical protein
LTIVFDKQRTTQVDFLARNNCYKLDALGAGKFRWKLGINNKRTSQEEGLAPAVTIHRAGASPSS